MQVDNTKKQIDSLQGKLLEFIEKKDFKGFFGFGSAILVIPSGIWAYLFYHYTEVSEENKENFNDANCGALVEMSERTMLMYGVFTLLGLLLFIWAYTIIGSGNNNKDDDEKKEDKKDDKDQAQATPGQEEKEGEKKEEVEGEKKEEQSHSCFKWVVGILPAIYFVMVFIVFLFLTFGHQDVDPYTCEPLRSFVLVYIVLHIVMFGVFFLTICCSLFGLAALASEYGVDGAIITEQVKNQNNDDQQKLLGDDTEKQNYGSGDNKKE